MAPLAASVAALLAACSGDMRDQPKAERHEATDFFRDGTTTRPVVAGTVARHEPLEQPAPPAVTPELLELGRARFNGICAACHGRDGYGEGMVVLRGFPAPPSLHEPRLRDVPDAHIHTVIRNGLGKMPPYAPMLSDRERHAVVAYVRALQLSQHAPAAALDADLRERLQISEGAGP